MAFNVGKYIQDTSKTAVQRVVDKVTSAVTSGLPNSAKSVAAASAQAFFDVGYSYESMSSFSANKTASIISNAADEFFAVTGKNPDRVSKANLQKLRRPISAKTHMEQINPASKIASAKSDGSVEIITVV